MCTYIGIELKEMSNKKILTFSTISIILCIVLFIYFFITENQFVMTSKYKYPPRLYYLSYSIGISLLLYYIIGRKNIFNIKERFNNPIILFISKHSMWIYLWHIPFIFCIDKLYPNMHFLFKYIILLCGALILTYIQTKIIEKLNIKNKTLLSILNG